MLAACWRQCRCDGRVVPGTDDYDAFLTETRQMDRILRNFLTLTHPGPEDESDYRLGNYCI